MKKKTISKKVKVFAIILLFIGAGAISLTISCKGDQYRGLLTQATEDAYTIPGVAAIEYMEIRTDNGSGGEDTYPWDGYVRFETLYLDIPSGSTITNATLSLYYWNWRNSNPAGRNLSVYRVMSNWNEENVTWLDFPQCSLSPTSYSTIPSSTGVWMKWNVTKDVQAFSDGIWANYGWKISDKNKWYDPYFPICSFRTKEYGQVSQEPVTPQLEVSYLINTPPTAEAGGPYTGYANDLIAFNGAGSNDPYDSITGYRWDFNNDGIYDTDWLTSSTTTHSFSSAETYTIKLQVKDNDGYTADDTATVTVSPSRNIPLTDDTTISIGSDTPAGYGERMIVRNNYGGGGSGGFEYDALVKFDTSSIPSGAIIESASLHLYYWEWGDSNPAGRKLNLYRAMNNWDEETLIWNNQPSYASQPTGNSTVPFSIGFWMEWDVAKDIQGFVNGTFTNYGWKITDENYWGGGSIPVSSFRTKEYGNYMPYLEVEYILEETNIPPTADAGGPYSANVGETITFNGSGSSDSDGTITGYRWDFTNDGTYDTDWLTSPSTTHSYPSTGTYTVNLEVKDNVGGTDSDTVTVTIILKNLPTANANGPYSRVVNSPITFSSDGSYGGSEGTIVSWYWTFGDGDVSSQQNPTHTYTSTGTFSVILKVTNNYGETNIDTTTAKITATPPPIADAGGPYSGSIGLPITFDGSHSSDSDGTITSYLWNFGDNTTGMGVSPTHTYNTPGNYTVVLTVTDNDGLTDLTSITASIEWIENATLVITVPISNIEPIEEENEKTIPVTVYCFNRPVSNVHLEILESSNLTVTLLSPNITLNPGESKELLIKIKAPKLQDTNNSEDKVSDETIILRAVGDGNITSDPEQVNLKVIEKNATPGFETIATLAAAGTAGALVTFFRRRNGNR